MERWRGVLDGALSFHCDAAQITEIAICVAVLNHMPDVGRPNSIRNDGTQRSWSVPLSRSPRCNSPGLPHAGVGRGSRSGVGAPHRNDRLKGRLLRQTSLWMSIT